MNKLEAYKQGYARGWNGAAWVDMPSIGDTLPPDVDWEGVGTIADASDMLAAWEMLCAESESRDRAFSPFEVTASAINESRDPDGYWEAFDAGIEAGRRAYRRNHHPLRSLRREASRQAKEHA